MGTNTQAVMARQKEKMIDALEANFGNITAAAKAAKITPRTHYRWLKEDWEYAQRAENIKDICYRKIKDNLLDNALKRIEKGDSSVLNKMLSIYFKNVPYDMQKVGMYNNVPIKVNIKYIDTPQDPKREGYVKKEE